ncbi:acetyl-CoA-benzylalcohol acetyltransferase-like [Solanum lycopersicum]|uniref:acetyl-CoA-benzylalcohol acetyltransferase-like n=1 Tax=Solanum lycopersicum TaxID=4081 RepID=UPI003748DB78
MESTSLAKINILSKDIIRSFPISNHDNNNNNNNNVDHPKNYKLSFFDQIALQMHVPCVLFYPLKYSTSPKISIIHEQLQQSLSKLLTHVYPASGRFSSDAQSINCHDEGLLYIKAKVDSQFCDFLKDAQKDIDLALNFCPKINRNDSNLSLTPLVVVQVTEFACGKGLALSLSAEHAVIDGFTALKFVYEWSKVSKMGINKINCFTFDDFGTIFPPTSDNHLLKRVESPRDDHVKMVARRFVINQSVISKLREHVGVVYFRPSRVELVIAFLWSALINIFQRKNNGRMRPCLLSVPVNLRGKIDFPRYENSFGNFAIEVPVKFIPGETGMELKDILLLIKDVIQKTNISFEKSSDDIYTLASKFHKEIQEWEENEQVDVCMASSLCRFPINEADFGWGKPCLLSLGLRRSDMFWLYDTPCGSGIIVQVDLKKDYMDMFGCDKDVLSFICDE